MRLLPALFATIILAYLTGVVQAQQPANELADLRSRIEALERENQQLQQTLVERLPSAGAVVEPSGAGYVNITPQFGSANDDARVRSIVEQYLQERAPQMVAAEVAAPGDAGAAAAGSEVGQDLTM